MDFGVYLAEPGEEDKRVLLPARQVPPQTSVGDQIEVFLYKDSSDRLISTTARPKLLLGEVVELTVAQTAKMGAFLEWGLEKRPLPSIQGADQKGKRGRPFPGCFVCGQERAALCDDEGVSLSAHRQPLS